MKVAEFLCESQHNRDEEIQVSNYKFYTNRKNFDKPLKRRDGKIVYPVYERYSTKRIKKVYSISRETISSGGAHLSDDKNEVVDSGNVETPLLMTKVKVSKINYKTKRNEKTKNAQLLTNKSSEERVININDYNKIVMVQKTKNTNVLNSGRHKKKRNSFSDTDFASKSTRPTKYHSKFGDLSPALMKTEMVMNVEAPMSAETAESAGTEDTAGTEGTEGTAESAGAAVAPGDECGCNTNSKQYGDPKCGCCKCTKPEPPRQEAGNDDQFSCICTKGKQRKSVDNEGGEENDNEGPQDSGYDKRDCSCIKRFQKISQDDGFRGYQDPSCKPCATKNGNSYYDCGGRSTDILMEKFNDESDCACIPYKEDDDDDCPCARDKHTVRRSSRGRSRRPSRSSSKRVSVVGHSRSYDSLSSGEKYNKKTTFEEKPYYSKMNTDRNNSRDRTILVRRDFRASDYPKRSEEEDCHCNRGRKRDAHSNTDNTDFFSSTGCFYSDSKGGKKNNTTVRPSNRRNKSTAAVQTYAYSPFSYSETSVNVCEHCSSYFKQDRRQSDKWLCEECEERICKPSQQEEAPCCCSSRGGQKATRRPTSKASTGCQCSPRDNTARQTQNTCMCKPQSNNTHSCRCENKNEYVQVIECPSKCKQTKSNNETKKSKQKKKSGKSKKVTACECKPPVRDASNTICMRSESSLSAQTLENAISSTVFHRRRKSKGCNIHAHVKMENQEIKHYEGNAAMKERAYIQQETRHNKGKSDVESSIKEILNFDPMKSVEVILPPKPQISNHVIEHNFATTAKLKQQNVRSEIATDTRFTSNNDISNNYGRQDCLFKRICKKPIKLWSSVGRNDDVFKKKNIAPGNRVTTVYNAATEGDAAAPPAEGAPPADGAAPPAEGASAEGASPPAEGAAPPANGAANGTTNGTANGAANGTTNGATNGAANGAAAEKKEEPKGKKKKEKKQKMDACLCKPPIPSCTCNCKALAPEKAANCQCKTDSECPNCDGSKRPKTCDCSERIHSKEFQAQIRRDRAMERKRERSRPKCKCTSERNNDNDYDRYDYDRRFERRDHYERRNTERELIPTCDGSYDAGRRNQRNGYNNELYSRRSSTYDQRNQGARSQSSMKSVDRCGCNSTHGFNEEERDYSQNQGAARSQSSMKSANKCSCNNIMKGFNEDDWERGGARNMSEQRSSRREACRCCGGKTAETNNYGRNSYGRDDYGRNDYRSDYGRNDYSRNADDCDCNENAQEEIIEDDEGTCCPCKKGSDKKKNNIKSFFSKFMFAKTVNCTGECKKNEVRRSGRREVYPVHTYSLIKVDEKMTEKKASDNVPNVQDVYNVHINVKMNKRLLPATKHYVAPLMAVNDKFRKFLLFVKDVIPEADKFLNGIEIENVPKSTASVREMGQFGKEFDVNRRSVRSATSPERIC